MSEHKVAVPEGMLRAAVEVARADVGYPHPDSDHNARVVDITRRTLEAALIWLSENPIVPTPEDAEGIFERVFSDPPYIYGTPGDGMPGQTVNISRVQLTGRHLSKEQKVFSEWQRRMFLPREVPEFVECDSCRAKPGSPTLCRGCRHNREVIESFRRGHKAGSR